MRTTDPDTIEKRDMVRWFHPGELLRTAFHALFSTTIAGYTDRRETLASLPVADRALSFRECSRLAARPHSAKVSARRERLRGSSGRARIGSHPVFGSVDPLASPAVLRTSSGCLAPRKPVDGARTVITAVECAPAHTDESAADAYLQHVGDGVWIDFVADIGDGFDPTYATSALLARKHLRVSGLGPGHRLPRADILVLGGDLVYPTPARDQYRVRLRGPLQAALPEVDIQREEVPSIFAIPGNHDWYDGLTNFIREFCQGHWIGGWRTWQRRSYFAVHLFNEWWLWGIDIQFQTRIDPPQLRYFRQLVSNGDRVILCTALPSWYRAADVYTNLQYFEDTIVRENNARIELVLAGDIHHYARFSLDATPGDGKKPGADDCARHLITSGGGGSYIRGTHQLPPKLTVERRNLSFRWEGDEPAFESSTYVRTDHPYPSPERSRKLALRALAFPFLTGNARFCLIIGAVYSWLVALLAISARPVGGPGAPARRRGIDLRAMLDASPDGVAGYLLRHAGAVAVIVLILAVSASFCVVANDGHGWPKRAAWGAAHGAAHALLAAALAVAIARFGWLPEGFWLERAAFYGSIVAAGALAGGLLFGAYLVLSDRSFGWHENEVFACQSIPHYRSFIRLHLEPAGKLTIYPLGIERVPRRWRRRERTRIDPSVLQPNDGTRLEVHLIEGPIIL